MRYTPDTDRLEISPVLLSHDVSYQSGWHSVFYDIAPSPDRECVYAASWCPNPRLMRIWSNQGAWPRVEDLGPATQKRDTSFPIDMYDLRQLPPMAATRCLFLVRSQKRCAGCGLAPRGRLDQKNQALVEKEMAQGGRYERRKNLRNHDQSQ